MKILLLNPHVNAQHKLVLALQNAGHGVLLPEDAQEAWQMLQLHGASVDLAIIHREFIYPSTDPRTAEPGINLVERIKADAVQADLPIILSSSVWKDADFFGRHQQTPVGANAYLTFPFDENQIQLLIKTMFAESGGTGNQPPPFAQTEAPAPAPAAPDVPAVPDVPGETVLEDASALFSRPEMRESEDSGSPLIQLDAPEIEAIEDEPDQGPVAVEMPPPEPGGRTFATMEIPLDALGTGQIDLSSVQIEGLGGGPDGPSLNAQTNTVPLPPDGESLSALALEMDGPASPPPAPALSELISLEGQAAVDPVAAHQMPYLFQKSGSGAPTKPAGSAVVDPSLVFTQPVGDSIVPGGAAHTPDVETLKKYLLLREQDVGVLSAQLQAAQDRIHTLEEDVRGREANNVELGHELDEVKRKLADHDKDKQAAVSALQRELQDVRFEIRAKTDKARVLEAQVTEAAEDIERLKERVRSDIRKIRVREKELENRLEIMKKDSEALIAARENKIIELKRKIDLLEFNMDLLQDQYTREKEHSTRMRERLTKASQVVRVAGALLDGTEREIEAKYSDPVPGSDAKKQEAV